MPRSARSPIHTCRMHTKCLHAGSVMSYSIWLCAGKIMGCHMPIQLPPAGLPLSVVSTALKLSVR